MKYIGYILLLPILFVACRKNKKDDNGGTGANNFAYTIKYDSVAISQAGVTYNFPFYIKVTGGNIDSNKLTCSIEGLPISVTVEPPSMTVGNLLGGVFSFKIYALPYGDYPFRIKVQSTKYGLQVYNAVLRIVAPPDYTPLLAGSYDSSYDFCSLTGINPKYFTGVYSVPDTAFLLKITNPHNWGTSHVVRAWVYSTVTIPAQVVNGKTMWGSGTYSHDARPGHGGHYIMEIKDTFAAALDTEYCTIHIEH